MMSNQTAFFRSQAYLARSRSEDAELDNVRDCHLRAAAAWDVLAARSDKSDRLRAAEALRKSEPELPNG